MLLFIGTLVLFTFSAEAHPPCSQYPEVENCIRHDRAGPLLLQTKAKQSLGVALPSSAFFEEDAVQSSMPEKESWLALHDVGVNAVPVPSSTEEILSSNGRTSEPSAPSVIAAGLAQSSAPIAVEPPLAVTPDSREGMMSMLGKDFRESRSMDSHIAQDEFRLPDDPMDQSPTTGEEGDLMHNQNNPESLLFPNKPEAMLAVERKVLARQRDLDNAQVRTEQALSQLKANTYHSADFSRWRQSEEKRLRSGLRRAQLLAEANAEKAEMTSKSKDRAQHLAELERYQGILRDAKIADSSGYDKASQQNALHLLQQPEEEQKNKPQLLQPPEEGTVNESTDNNDPTVSINNNNVNEDEEKNADTKEEEAEEKAIEKEVDKVVEKQLEKSREGLQEEVAPPSDGEREAEEVVEKVIEKATEKAEAEGKSEKAVEEAVDKAVGEVIDKAEAEGKDVKSVEKVVEKALDNEEEHVVQKRPTKDAEDAGLATGNSDLEKNDEDYRPVVTSEPHAKYSPSASDDASHVPMVPVNTQAQEVPVNTQAASTPSELGPDYEGSCVPKCTWSCSSPKCDEVCDPVCDAPKCETRCSGISTDGCSMECTKPHCQVVCPKHLCAGEQCPSCTTKCSEPQCKLKCPKSQPCENICEQPRCDWKCKAPSNCPKPECKMVCETPKKCQSSSFLEELPPLKAGQLSVASFVAPTHVMPPVVTPVATQMEETNTVGSAMPVSASAMVDVNVRSLRSQEPLSAQHRVVSMPVLPHAAVAPQRQSSWVVAQAGAPIQASDQGVRL